MLRGYVQGMIEKEREKEKRRGWLMDDHSVKMVEFDDGKKIGLSSVNGEMRRRKKGLILR